MIDYILEGKPTPLSRPRFAKGYNHVYDSQIESKRIDASHIKYTRDNSNHSKLYDEPVLMILDFYFEMPKSWNEKKRDLMNNTPYSIKPDLDNLVKYIADVCNGILYTDDSLIVTIQAKKLWSYKSRTVLSISKYNSIKQ